MAMLERVMEKTNHYQTGSSYQTYMSFSENFMQVFQTGQISTIVEFLEEFCEKCPLGRNYLVQAFVQLSSIGLLDLANECGRIHAETSERLLNEAQTKLGLPPIYEYLSINPYHVSIMDQTVLAKTRLGLGNLKQKPVLTLGNDSAIKKKPAFLPYLCRD